MKYLKRFNSEEERTQAVLSSPNVSGINSPENVYYDNEWTTVAPNQSEYWTANWQFIRPSDWPDLDIFDWTDTYGFVATYDCRRRIADNTINDGFYLWVANYCNGILERGTIVNGSFVVNNTVEVLKNTYYRELLPTNEGDFVVYRFTLDNDSGYISNCPNSYGAAQRSADGYITYFPTCCELIFNIPSTREMTLPGRGDYCKHFKSIGDPGKNGVFTSFPSEFYYNYQLECIDTTGWTLNNVTSLSGIFSGRGLKKIIGIENWKLDECTNLANAFNYSLIGENLDLRNWKPNKLTNCSNMFQYCFNLRTVNLAGWNTSNLTNIISMFQYCYNLKSIDLTGWDFSKISTTNARNIFVGCWSLEELKISTPISFAVATQISSMFDGCRSLENNPLHEATVTMPNVTTVAAMFAGNQRLTEMDMTNWDFSSVNATGNMFLNCYCLKKAVFPSSCAFLTNSTFDNCYNLEIIVVKAITPPTWAITTGYINEWNPNYKIYVPDASVEDYKAATGWLNAADHIYGISEMES